MRNLKYSEAIAEAMYEALLQNPNLFLIGEGIDDPKGAFGTTTSALKEFGKERVMDSPLSENALAGICIGAAIEGYPSIQIHMRAEFMVLALDQILNHAAKWNYMFNGKMNVPMVFRCIVGRGWGQAAQHSQSFHNLYAQFPGLKVILPSHPYDAKGLLLSAVEDPNPVICIEHRWLYEKVGLVPENSYRIPIGNANTLTTGKDVTCVALSLSVHEALEAQAILKQEGIELEVIDLRSVRPLDFKTIFSSVEKTGRLLIADISHTFMGIGAEITAQVAENRFEFLKAPVIRIGLPDAPTPCAPSLEAAYYPGVNEICIAARKLMQESRSTIPRTFSKETPLFTGPF